MMTVDQLPESRRAILTRLKTRGAATIAQLAEELHLTGEAVRQQLLQLQRDGWVEPKLTRGAAERGRTGRPATSYSLSEKGDHLFPKQYDVLNTAMLDAVAELGPDAARRVLARIADDRVTSMEPVMRDQPLAERVAALKNWYMEGDPFMEIAAVEDGYHLIERNCPFYNTAMRRPVLCSVSINALTRLLGVRVRRTEKFQRGDGRCVFHIQASQPIVPQMWQFGLESELEGVW